MRISKSIDGKINKLKGKKKNNYYVNTNSNLITTKNNITEYNLNNLNKNYEYKQQKTIKIDLLNSDSESYYEDRNLYQMKTDISDIKQKLNEFNSGEIKNELSLLKNEILQIKNILIQHFKLSNENKNLDNIIDNNTYNTFLDSSNSSINSIIKVNNMNQKELIQDKTVIISMNDLEHSITVNNKMTLEEFKYEAKKILKIYGDVKMHYFNFFGVKKIILNENDFKHSLNQKYIKYYITKDNENLLNTDYNFIISSKKNKKHKYKISKSLDSIFSNNLEEKEVKEEKEKEIKEAMNNLASISSHKIDNENYIQSAAFLSKLMKNTNQKEQKKHPEKFNNIKVSLKYPELISNQFDKKDYNFILSLIAQILGEKGTLVSVYKKNQDINKLDGASLQYLFSGLTEKKKYKIIFDPDINKNKIFSEKDDELKDFIEDFKSKISKELKMNKSDVFLVNPKNNNGLCSIDFVPNKENIEYKKLLKINKVKDIKKESLIEGCQLSSDIFDPSYNNQDEGWGIGEKRGGEDYISPLGWFGFGLKVKGKYDNGNNDWIGYNNKNGEFAVAYFGISNLYGNKKNMSYFLHEIYSKDVLKMGYEQTFENDLDLRNPTKKCGNGVYLFQDPKIAESTSGIYDIGGVRYKILLMCRVNPKKIRQPKGFKDCWILNYNPSEIRPYKILVKKIIQSPLTGASQNEIMTFSYVSKHYKDIIKQKDTSFLNSIKTNLNKNDYIIRLYTGPEYIFINNYLRDKIILKEIYNEKQIKSIIWCLHFALTSKKNNIKNGTILYRGVRYKFPDNLEVGSKFIFAEFISTSRNKETALDFADGVTLFVIRIENNYPNSYCCDIAYLSKYPTEEEVLITSNCTFRITKREKNEENVLEAIYLTCEGYKNDI